MLVHLAKVVRSRLRGGDWAFRIGGEEFCLLLPATTQAGAVSAAEALRRQVAERPYDLDGDRVPLSASIGVAVFPQDGRGIPGTGL